MSPTQSSSTVKDSDAGNERSKQIGTSSHSAREDCSEDGSDSLSERGVQNHDLPSSVNSCLASTIDYDCGSSTQQHANGRTLQMTSHSFSAGPSMGSNGASDWNNAETAQSGTSFSSSRRLSKSSFISSTVRSDQDSQSPYYNTPNSAYSTRLQDDHVCQDRGHDNYRDELVTLSAHLQLMTVSDKDYAKFYAM